MSWMPPMLRWLSPRTARIGALVLVLASPASAVEVVIDNGSAPPDPNNVFTATDWSADLLVRDAGCAGQPLPCPSPGPSTTVELQGKVYSFTIADSSTGIITAGGLVADSAAALNSSLLEIAAGGAARSLTGQHQASILLSGGSMNDELDYISMFHDSRFSMTSGYISGILRLYDGSSAQLTGGFIADVVRTSQNATALIDGATIYGGEWSVISAQDDSLIVISGGHLSGAQMHVQENGVIRLVGSGFAVDGNPVGYGRLETTSGYVTGMLADGSAFSDYFDQSNATTIGGIWVVPEPTTALLLGAGLLALSAVRRRAS